MDAVDRQSHDGIATLTIRRGKVNALNEETVTSLRQAFEDAERDPNTRAVILTGAGKFFSFGFDVPELFGLSPDAFTGFVTRFAALYRYMFVFPKPILAAINGHAVAGGCMLVLPCDYRLMTSDRGTIGLNEISFGATVFAGSVEMLRFCAGPAAASEILLGGALYPAADAVRLGLLHEAIPGPDLESRARAIAALLAALKQPAFRQSKLLLRREVAEQMVRQEAESIERFVEIWYSKATRAELQKIVIHA